MARLELADGCSLRRARRVMTERGSGFRLTLRGGRLYTMKRVRCVQPDSVEQLKCRELLVRANEMARRDFEEVEKVEYWKKKAEETGYKTARGCARAWYVRMLKERVVEMERREMEKREAEKSEMVGSVSVEKKMVENVCEVRNGEGKSRMRVELFGVRNKEVAESLRIGDVVSDGIVCGRRGVGWKEYCGLVRWRRRMGMSKN